MMRFHEIYNYITFTELKTLGNSQKSCLFDRDYGNSQLMDFDNLQHVNDSVFTEKKNQPTATGVLTFWTLRKIISISWNWHWATVFPWILTSNFLGCGHGSKVLRPVDPWFAYRSSCVYRPIFGAGVSYLDSYNARAVASGDQFSYILMCAKDIQSPLGVHYISEPEMTRPPLVSLGQPKNDLYPLASFKSTCLPSFNGYKSLHIKHYQHVNF